MYKHIVKAVTSWHEPSPAVSGHDASHQAGHVCGNACGAPCRDLRVANQKLILLQEIMAKINSEADVMEVLRLVVESYVTIVGTPMCSLRLLQSDGISLAVAVSAGFSGEYQEMDKVCHIDSGPCGLAATSLSMVEVADFATDPRFSDQRRLAEAGGYRSVLVLPLAGCSGQLLGTMASYYVEPHQSSPDEKQIAQLFGMQAAIAIENACLREKLHQLSVTDGMTGAFNYRYFMENLEREVARSKRWKRSLSLVMIDIDNFKKFNDTYGHQQGDLVLRTVTRILQEGVRASDIVARYGGEELVVILPETDGRDGLVIAERLRQAVAEHHFPNEQVTISIGVVSYPENGQEPDELVAAADAALYEAKRLGKNRCCSREGASKPDGDHRAL